MYSQPPPRPGVFTRETAVTHPSLHIRDVHDAHVLLEAVRLNVLPLLKRRLLASERDELQTGHIYVWEEAQDDGGLLRWTDGRRWSQSRMRGDYLFYEEKIETTQEERDAKAARRARRASDPTAIITPPVRRKDRPSKPNGLTKQTYSVTVNLPGSSEPRKWHVVAYFSGDDYTRLPVIENYAYLRNIHVPSGIFFSNKVLCSRTDGFTPYPDECEPQEEPFSARHAIHEGSVPRTIPTPSSPIASSIYPPHSPPPSTKSPRVFLPPISSLGGPYGKPPELPYPFPSHSQGRSQQPQYTPLSSEDRRALQKFKVVL